jgi:serine/threonine-protein kinase HipA
MVYVDVDGQPVRCGTLFTRSIPRESATFEYDDGWRTRPGAFALDPELPLTAGAFHSARALFRAFTDPAPDRWGQTLLRRAERARAKREGRAPRTLSQVDFLVLVQDETRLGALRFRDASEGERSPFLSSATKPVPPLLELPRLLQATSRIVAESETDDDLALVLAPGTSLGGARPKASVRGKEGELLIAKFPRRDDDWPMTRWEATTLSLARAAAIRVPEFRLETVAQKPVIMLQRFDRRAHVRIPFMSAMTALSAGDDEPRSYLDIVDALRQGGSQVTADLVELWRRLVFNVLVSNTDDHLRNHGFLHDGIGWRLAPAYDLNPMPTDVRPRIHVLALNESDHTGSLEVALEVAPRFGIPHAHARAIAREVAAAVRPWRAKGAKLGLTRKDLERMESAFEHADLVTAAK